MKYFFCYEKTTGDKWSPVLYHNEAPKIKDGYILSTNGQLRPVTSPVVIEQDDEPSFTSLMQLYPEPQRTQIMVRPVEGFRTKDGKFFETENDAERHEVTYIITEKLHEFLKDTAFSQLMAMDQDQLVLGGMQFVAENAETVRRYLDTLGKEETVSSTPIPDTGSASETVS